MAFKGYGIHRLAAADICGRCTLALQTLIHALQATLDAHAAQGSLDGASDQYHLGAFCFYALCKAVTALQGPYDCATSVPILLYLLQVWQSACKFLHTVQDATDLFTHAADCS